MKVQRINQFLPMKNASAEKKIEAKSQGAADDKKLRESAKQLEGLFIGFILKAMEKTIPKADDQKSNNMVSMMFSSVMGRELAEQGGFGLSDYLYRSMALHGDVSALQNLQNNLAGDARFNISITENNDE